MGRGPAGGHPALGAPQSGHCIPGPLNRGQAGIGTRSGRGNPRDQSCNTGSLAGRARGCWAWAWAWPPHLHADLLCDLGLAAHPLWVWWYLLVSHWGSPTLFLGQREGWAGCCSNILRVAEQPAHKGEQPGSPLGDWWGTQ